jgi:beta-glucanase (GH16 family)
VPPIAVNGEWVFNIPAGVAKNIRPRSKLPNFGYGHYKITFRTSGPRVSGIRYSPFLYLDQTSSGGPFNELDIPELFGSQSPTTMSISTYKGSDPNNAYNYFESSINFEDGQTHTWEFNYLPDKLEFYVDGVLQYWTDPNNPYTAKMIPCIADPPMYLYILVDARQGNLTTQDWTFYLNQIEYQALS